MVEQVCEHFLLINCIGGNGHETRNKRKLAHAKPKTMYDTFALFDQITGTLLHSFSIKVATKPLRAGRTQAAFAGGFFVDV